MPTDLYSLISLIINLLSIAVIARALMSWFDPTMRSPVGRFLYDVTEPIMAPIRRYIPSLGSIDISPIVALILLWLLRRVLLGAIA